MTVTIYSLFIVLYFVPCVIVCMAYAHKYYNDDWDDMDAAYLPYVSLLPILNIYFAAVVVSYVIWKAYHNLKKLYDKWK